MGYHSYITSRLLDGKDYIPGQTNYYQKQRANHVIYHLMEYMGEDLFDDMVDNGCRYLLKSFDSFEPGSEKEREFLEVCCNRFQKQFRQADVFDSGDLDMVFWNILHLENDFWDFFKQAIRQEILNKIDCNGVD